MTNHDIATLIMGWKLYEDASVPFYTDKDDVLYLFEAEFNPLSNAQDDCIVLKHIRENWDDETLSVYDNELMKRRLKAEKWPFLSYEPGDFSRAALKVIEESESER